MTRSVQIIAHPEISIQHHRIHEGNHFFVHKISLGINIANPKYYLIIPPPSAGEDTVEIHVIFAVVTDIGGVVSIFEGTSVSNNGTELTIVNNNRRINSTTTAKIYEDPSVTTEGTKIFDERKGTTTSGGEIGEFNRGDEELILHPDKKYLIKFVPLADGANITFEINWYDNMPSHG